MNNRRISSCLHDIEAHTGQDLHSSRSAGSFPVGFCCFLRAATKSSLCHHLVSGPCANPLVSWELPSRL